MMHESKQSLQHIYTVYEMTPYDVEYVLCMDVYAWWEALYILFFYYDVPRTIYNIVLLYE